MERSSCTMSPKPFASGTMIVATQLFSTALDRMRADFLETGDGGRVLAARTAIVDESVCAAVAPLLAALPAGFTLLAVGGYGRRQLFPYSDVDLLLLFDNDRMPEMARET